MYYSEMTCMYDPRFQTTATDDVKVIVVNDTRGDATVISRSYGAWGCHGSSYPGHVCQTLTLSPGDEWPFHFNSLGHCKGFFIVSAEGSRYFLLRTKQKNIRINVSQMIREGSPTDLIGRLGCGFSS
jgi:hypothetical protein